MNLLIIIFIFFYLLMAQRLFTIWHKFFQQDTSMSAGETQLSWLVLILGAVLWPIVVPNAYLALLEKKYERKKEY
jgi:hypothetical protein